MWVINCLFWNIVTITTEKYNVNVYYRTFNWLVDFLTAYLIWISYTSNSHILKLWKFSGDPINGALLI